MSYIYIILLLIGSYLLGSIPFAYLLTKIVKKIDIRTVGSKNLGATNVMRSVSKRLGLTVLLLDFLKGFIPVFISMRFFPDKASTIIAILSGILTVCGHNWPVFLKFSGGKGVATSAGVCIALIPVDSIIVILIFVSIWSITRYISLGSIVAAVLLPAICWLTKKPAEISIFITIIGLAVIYRHKSNIKRLITGTENKL